jgi:hypothetical protein
MPAAEPFVFQGCVQACEPLPHEVHDARQALEQINQVPLLSAAPAHANDPFRFLQYHLVPRPTGHQVRTLWEFRDAFSGIDVTASVVSG